MGIKKREITGYKIVASGPGREALTWASDFNLGETIERLRKDGYTNFETTLREED